MNALTKKWMALAILTVSICTSASAQQWSGNSNTTDPIGRTGNVGIGILIPEARFQVAGGEARFGLSPDYSYFSNSGNLSFAGEAYYRVLPNQWAFKGAQNIGLRFHAAEDRLEFTDNNSDPMFYTSIAGARPGVGYFAASLGIGVEEPTSTLHVKGMITQETETDENHSLVLSNPSADRIWKIFQLGSQDAAAPNGFLFEHYDGISHKRKMTIDESGNVGIGIDSPENKLHVKDGGITVLNGGVGIRTDSDVNHGYNLHNEVAARSWNMYQLSTQHTHAPNGFLLEHHDGNNGLPRLTIDESGNVGIGTMSPQSKLAVAGKVTAQEVEVTLSGWSDFVFEDDYELRSLEELDAYISNNGHLPDIPSEKEVLENGVKIGEMQSRLLQKIEELTLYLIEMNKEKDALKKRLRLLE